MMKAKKYDWKDSNMALFGSDTEKQVKKESAESEPMWQGAGQDVGVKIWRVVKFEITEWPVEDYGNFYSGDSYIILNTYKQDESDELLYDVHFWIGKYSTQDEYGTAAYKTVELDTFLDDKPIQHREVQGHESELFKSYFETLTYMKGGADTGFRHVEPEEYTPRLLKIKKESRKNITVTEVKRVRGSLTSDDVFVLDNGLTIYQWNGSSCSHDEKYKAAREVSAIASGRPGSNVETLEESSTREGHPFYELLNGDDDDDDDDDDAEVEGDPVLLKVSDSDGSLDMEVVEADVCRDSLSSEDVFIIDTKKALFVWVGSGASIDERRNGLSYAHQYLNKTEYPWLPVSVVAEGKEQYSNDFKSQVPGCA